MTKIDKLGLLELEVAWQKFVFAYIKYLVKNGHFKKAEKLRKRWFTE